MSPQDASINGDGFRFYRFSPSQVPEQQRIMAQLGLTEEQRTQPTDVLSVTSIKSLCGEPFQLVRWKVGNVVNVATGQRKAEWRDYSKSKRGRRVEGYRKDGLFPGEFVTRMIETRGDEDKISAVREWLKLAADEPRDTAAVRGSVVHKLIEANYPLRKITDELVTERFEQQWATEDRRVKLPVTAEDVAFATSAMRNYWDMREHVPFVILAQEPQVFNLDAGYAGSADVLMWFLPDDVARIDLPVIQAAADAGNITLADVEKVGGFLAIGDWKTSKDVYTAHVVQTTAYLAAQFVAADGIIDTRLTALLKAAMKGLVIHIRPNGWSVDWFPFRQDVLMAFLGSVAYARFVAGYKSPTELFDQHLEGTAPETDAVEEEEAA